MRYFIKGDKCFFFNSTSKGTLEANLSLKGMDISNEINRGEFNKRNLEVLKNKSEIIKGLKEKREKDKRKKKPKKNIKK